MKKYLQFFSTVLLVFFMTTPVFGQKSFANRVVYVSTEYNDYPDGWCAAHMLGKPDVYPKWGDIDEAWTPDEYGYSRDTAILSFDNNGPIDSIFIYETYTAGYIDSIWVKNMNTQNWNLVYHASPSYYGDSSRILAVGFPLTTYNVNEVKITLANDLASNYIEIDAVAISPGSPSPIDVNVPGNSIKFDGIDDNFQTLISAHNALDTAETTIAAWVKVDGPAPTHSTVYDGAGIVSTSDAYAGIYHLNRGNGDSIFFYSYNSDTYAFGIDYVQGEWMHIAYVHDIDTLLAYRDGLLVHKIYCPPTEGFYGGFIEIGYNDYNDEYFNGEIEAVSLYDRALSQEEIRESMHVMPAPNTPGLTAHYNFNKSIPYYLDGYNPMIIGSPTFLPSTRPIGPGVARSQIESTGYVQFSGTGIIASYSNQNAGEVTVSRINNFPYAPQTGVVVDSIYWVFNQFSNSGFTADLIFTINEEVYSSGVTDCRYALYTRPITSSGPWTFIDTANVLTKSSLTFSDVDQSIIGQLLIVREGNCFGIGIDELVKEDAFVLVYPIPSSGLVHIDFNEDSRYSVVIYNTLGQQVYSQENVTDNIQIQLNSGVYHVHVSNKDRSKIEKIIIH